MAHGGLEGERRGEKDALEAFHCPSELFLEGRRKPEVGLAGNMTGSDGGSHTMYESVSVCSSGVSLLQGRPTRSQPKRKKQAGEIQKSTEKKWQEGWEKRKKEGSPELKPRASTGGLSSSQPPPSGP
ncbi:hypothetical protein ACMYSQ_005995 [Aspergillus niger]